MTEKKSSLFILQDAIKRQREGGMTDVASKYPGRDLRRAEDDLNAFLAAYWSVRAAALAGYDAEVTLPAVEAADAALAKLRGETT